MSCCSIDLISCAPRRNCNQESKVQGLDVMMRMHILEQWVAHRGLKESGRKGSKVTDIPTDE